MTNSGTNDNCKTCGSVLQGAYCHVCGEKRLSQEDKSARRWLGEVFSNLWMLDGKLLVSLKRLLVQPGRFAMDYIQGVRKPYVKPLNLFLIFNLIYFMTPGFNTFKTNLRTQMVGLPYSPLVENVITKQYEPDSMEFEAYRVAYNAKTNEVSKLIIILLAPLLGTLLYALFRSRGIFLSDGFNLALQFWASFICVFLVILPLVTRSAYYLLGSERLAGVNMDIPLTVIMIILSGGYLYAQFSWAERKKTLLSAKVLLVLISFLPLIFIYRFILFWITYWLV
jgi:hypothetical protein